MDEDIKAFLVESYENLDQIERDLVALEQNPSHPELLVSIYRSLHTIKGNCGFLAFPKLEAVTHSGENLLSRLRDGQLVMNADITSALLQLVDAIQQICAQIEATGQEGDADYSALVQRLNLLQQAAAGAGGEERQGENISSPSPALGEGQQRENFSSPSPASPAPKNTPSPSPPHAPKAGQSIRVDIALLDKLMNLVGELVLVRNQILQFSATHDETEFLATSQHLNQLTTELQEGVMKTRLQPISRIWGKLPRVVRDVAIASRKQVLLEMDGEETELDKTVIEAIRDPLTHLVRNCVDHGIESPAVRIAAGKPAEGRLTIQAFQESGYVNIEIVDDGAGIDTERLKQKAVAFGLISPERYNRLSDAEAVNLIFLPGFSTAKQVTRLSGRGVGMDVVKTNIEKVGGTVDVHTQLGQGTTFKLKIPLTLAIIPALIVTSGGDRYAIPQMNLLELVRLEGEQARRCIEHVHKAPVYRLRGKLLPLVYLNQELQLGGAGEQGSRGAGENIHPYSSHHPITLEDMVNIVVLQADADCPFGLVVDAINDTQEIVVKPLGKLLKEVPCFAGSTILGDGKVALILDVMSLAQRAGVFSDTQSSDRLEQETASQPLVDDRQMLLLFQIGDNGRMAIPMSVVVRLEEFPRATIEQVGEQMVIQYRDQILPLIDLATMFHTEVRSQEKGVRSQEKFICSLRSGQALYPTVMSSVLPPTSYSQGRGSPSNFHPEVTAYNTVETDIIQVVVVSRKDGRNVGLVVSQILDIVMESLNVTGAASRQGVEAIAVIQGQVTELLDLEAVCQ